MRTWIDIADRFPMKFDVERMRAEIDSLNGEKWLSHYDKTLSRNWKAILLVSIDGKMVNEESQRGIADYTRMARTEMVEKLPYFKEVLDAFKCRQGRVRILKLSPGAGIGLHRDIRHEAANLALGKVRLHIPIYTNDKVIFFVGGENIKMSPGRLYYVNFSKPHYVRNDGETDRLHLVLDLEVNEWLVSFFPELSVFDKVECSIQRWALPLTWKILYCQTKILGVFWRCYEGSIVQLIKNRLLTSLRKSKAD